MNNQTLSIIFVTNKKGRHPAKTAPKKMVKLIIEIADQNPAGFTLRIPTMRLLRPFEDEGILVAYEETQDSHTPSGLRKVIDHAFRNDLLIGGWLDEEQGLFYFDSVRRFPENELEEALKFAAEQNQIAVFRLSDAMTIRV